MTGTPRRSFGSAGTVGSALLLGGLLLVAGCVILTVLGPQVGNVFSRSSTGESSGVAVEVTRASEGEAQAIVVTTTPDYAATITSAQSATPVAAAPLAVTTTPEPNAPAPDAPPVRAERLIIREGSISIEVEDPRESRETIEGIVASFASQGAFVVSSEEQGGSDEKLPTITMIVRVPPTEFDKVMDRLAVMSIKVHTRSETAQDVTEEYVDLQGRVEAMEAGHRRLFAIMEAVTTTSDLLEVEDQLTDREAEMEALQGRMAYLSQSAQLSRIEITLRPHVPAPTPDKPLARWELNKINPPWLSSTVQRALDDLLSSGQNVLSTAIYFSIAILPWLLVLGVLLSGGWRWFWRQKDRSPSETTKQADDNQP